MGHIFLPKSRPKDEDALPGKYADTGIPAMIEEALKLGAKKSRLKAKMAGGANLFPNLNTNSTSIGQQNIEAVAENLKKHGITVIGKDVAEVTGAKCAFLLTQGW